MQKSLFLLLFLAPLFSLSQINQKQFVLSGTIQGLKDSTKVTLISGSNAQSTVSVISRNGSFKLKALLSEPDVYQLGFEGYKEVADLFIFNDSLSVIGNLNNVSGWVFSGSPIQDDYAYFKQQFNPYKDKLNSLAATINQEKDPAKRNSQLQEFAAAKSVVVKNAADFAKSKPSSAVSPFVLYVLSPLYDGGAVELESYYAPLNGLAKTGPYAKAIEASIMESKIGAIGSKAMDFTQKDMNGKSVSLSSFKGKYVLVDFWASWCGPCRQENPNLVRAYAQFKDKNFAILGVSIDKEKANWMQAMKADKLVWTNLIDAQDGPGSPAMMYRVSVIPTNFLIDPTGTIIGKNLRGAELENALRKFLK